MVWKTRLKHTGSVRRCSLFSHLKKKKNKSAQSILGWTQLEGQSSGHLQAFGLLQDVCECVWM